MRISAEGRVRANFAKTHMANAHRFALLAHEVETAKADESLGPFYEDIRANVVESIMLSVASLEAFVGAVVFDPWDPHRALGWRGASHEPCVILTSALTAQDEGIAGKPLEPE